MHSFVLYNDRIIGAGDKVLSPGQVGLLAGWGVFTTLRIYEGVPFEFERHWARMSKDAKLLRVPFTQDREATRRLLVELVRANQAENAAARLCVVRNQGGIWQGPGISSAADLIALTSDLKPWGPSMRLTVAPQARHAASTFAGAKILSWANNLTLVEDAQSRGFDEVILLNERDEVSECTSCNIFAVKDGQAFTPPLSSGCLPGITRLVLLEEIGEAGERVLRLDDLLGADEVFVTSTTRELLPISEIDGRPLPLGGPVRARLQQAFSDYVRRYVGWVAGAGARHQ
ncbi:MAG TPA: aminotransferase class IV [Bryobacterales bacterium]|nr:aminotransferase class IV [Bryobacterales bacterium]